MNDALVKKFPKFRFLWLVVPGIFFDVRRKIALVFSAFHRLKQKNIEIKKSLTPKSIQVLR